MSQCTYAFWENYQITFGIIIPLSWASAEGFKAWIIPLSSTSDSVVMFSSWYLYDNIYEKIHCSRHLGFPMQNLLQSIQPPKIFLTLYEKPIIFWFVLSPGQRTVWGEIFIEDSLHQMPSPFHHTQLNSFFSDAFGCPYSLFFLEWSLSLTFYKYSMEP